MNLPKYQLKAENSLILFEFTSEGNKGSIPKIIKFSETHLKDFYNLGFGDKDIETGDVDDLAISNNGDSEKVLATVVSAVYAFTDRYRDAWIYATGSTASRTRLYRIGISKHYDEAAKHFEIYGLLNDEWVKFEKGIEFDAFLIKRK
ncbi:hypothetical protein LRS05_12945 [Flavobacterium sp. J372]|uniref:DUF6934 family protein n=1 Tax=Flavobacterium sp. J372 TaxID=2898436 RepID=UPI0021519633|nr:hypothetical protein [Flavobacterium sp. J372]MCR5862982.1 hypothetical protein [Flavobacterium sp. J372]